MVGREQTLRVLRAIEYDVARRRRWLFGQRCHHGGAGAVLTAAAVGGLVATRISPPVTVALAATGSLLMVHDWKDRGMWFQPGYGTQP
jgi:hypothetical protein